MLNDGEMMTLATYQPTTPAGMPTPQEMMVYQTWAQYAENSQMYRTIGKESAIMMIMLAAREYGISPAQALNGGLHIIEGKVELSARMMSAMIRRAGHALKIVEDSDSKCTIHGRRSDTGEEHTVTYTIEQAQKAGLIKDKGGWRKVPDDMLFARCMSKLARRLFSDVIGIGYVQGEISGDQLTHDDRVIPAIQDDTKWKVFVSGLNPEDAELLDVFVEQIAQHYKKNTDEVHRLLMDDPGAMDKFKSWKARRSNENSDIIATTDV
jgi:hypothetical protein